MCGGYLVRFLGGVGGGLGILCVRQGVRTVWVKVVISEPVMND